MAGRTLTLDEINTISRRLMQAKGIADLAGQITNGSEQMDDTLSHSMWALVDLLDEAQTVLNGASDQGHDLSGRAQQ
jgi:hypothetical protein